MFEFCKSYSLAIPNQDGLKLFWYEGIEFDSVQIQTLANLNRES